MMNYQVPTRPLTEYILSHPDNLITRDPEHTIHAPPRAVKTESYGDEPPVMRTDKPSIQLHTEIKSLPLTPFQCVCSTQHVETPISETEVK